MALSINDPETERLVRELARATGESISVATRVALAERLQRVRRIKPAHVSEATLEDIISRGRERALMQSGHRGEDLSYDEDGLPR